MPSKRPITKQIKSEIEKVLIGNPGLLRTELAAKVYLTLDVTLNQVVHFALQMVADGELHVDRSVGRHHRFYVAGDAIQRVIRVDARRAKRLFFGPVVSPIEWCVSQLQGVA